VQFQLIKYDLDQDLLNCFPPLVIYLRVGTIKLRHARMINYANFLTNWTKHPQF
jgi:hypothetical protein